MFQSTVSQRRAHQSLNDTSIERSPSYSRHYSAVRHQHCLEVRFSKPLEELSTEELEDGFGKAICALLNTRRRGTCCLGVDRAAGLLRGVPCSYIMEDAIRRAIFQVTTHMLDPPAIDVGVLIRVVDIPSESTLELDRKRSHVDHSWKAVPQKGVIVYLPPVPSEHLEHLYYYKGEVYRAGGGLDHGQPVRQTAEGIEDIKALIPELRLHLPNFYVGQYLGSSCSTHKHTEFTIFSKVGMEVVERFMGQCLCGFLNSPAGGIFDLGVTQHTGLVLGFVCDRDQQVTICRILDEIANEQMSPQVMPDSYTTRFVPVVKKRGVDLAIPDHFRVMEVRVLPGRQLHAYCCKAYRWDIDTDALETVNTCTPTLDDLAMVYRWARSNKDHWRRQRQRRLRYKLTEVESYFEEMARRFHIFSESSTMRALIRGNCANETYV